jgi:hypothetical protein
MEFRGRVLYSLGFAVLLAGLGLAQSQPLITIDKVMTGEELRATGVEGLTSAQRSALDKWLSEYTLRVFQVAKGDEKPAVTGSGTASATYTGSSGGHWIRSTADGGAIIILEDGSMWGISSMDRIDTMLWLPVSNIIILKSSPSVGDYKYSLINTDDKEKALAKYLGKQ